jgi:hypothetical protein
MLGLSRLATTDLTGIKRGLSDQLVRLEIEWLEALMGNHEWEELMQGIGEDNVACYNSEMKDIRSNFKNTARREFFGDCRGLTLVWG